MPKKQNIQLVDKTELVWPGKRKEVERGVRNMALKNIERLAKALGVPIEDLIK